MYILYNMTPPAMDVGVEGVTDTSSILLPNPVLANGPTHAVFSVDDVAPHRAKSTPMRPAKRPSHRSLDRAPAKQRPR